MKIVVVGCGFVGGTVADFLEQQNLEVLRVDPKYYDLSIEDAVIDADCAIICVPTPQDDDGHCNADLVISLSNTISNLNADLPIMVKSTITPNIMDALRSDVIYNPEFLKEATAKEDFKNQHIIVLGVDELCKQNHIEFFVDLYSKILPGVPIEITDRNTASMIKYVHNSWLATKVAFFHQLYNINSNLANGFDYDKMTDVLSSFVNIGPSHMVAPNHKGSLGYGGSCFPKDVSGLIAYFKGQDKLHNILDEVSVVNRDLNNVMIDGYRSRVPNEPFVICLGTSHTFGECDGEKTEVNFWDIIAQELGVKMINIGLSGAKQLEFIQLVNELSHYGYLDSPDCKGLLFETRITDASFEFNLETLMHYSEINKVRVTNKSGKFPLLHRTGWGPIKTTSYDNKHNFNTTMNNFLYGSGAPDMVTEEQIKVQYNEIFDAENDKIYEHATKHDLKKLMDNLDYDLAFSNKNVASAFRDFQYLDIIKNLVVNKGIPFGWFLMDPREKLLPYCKELLKGKSDIFDYQMVDPCVGDMVHGIVSADGKELDDVKCECKHWNDEGNKIVADLLLDPVKKVLGDAYDR